MQPGRAIFLRSWPVGTYTVTAHVQVAATADASAPATLAWDPQRPAALSRKEFAALRGGYLAVTAEVRRLTGRSLSLPPEDRRMVAGDFPLADQSSAQGRAPAQAASAGPR